MDVRMPDGVVIRNVPEGTPKEVVLEKYNRRRAAPSPIPPTQDVIGLRGLIQQEHDIAPTPEENAPFKAGAAAFGTSLANRLRGLGQAGLSVAEAVTPGGQQFEAPQRHLAYLNALANANLEQRYPENEIAKTIGGVGGDIAALAPLLALGPSGFVAQGALGGGVEGFTRPSERPDTLTGRSVQGGVGAITGALTSKALKEGGKFVIQKGEKLGKILGFGDQNISDIFSNLDNYGLQQNIANERVGEILGNEAKRQSRKINVLYGRAKAQGQNIQINTDDAFDLSNSLARHIKSTIPQATKDALSNVKANLDDLLENNQFITVNDLETIRNQASVASAGKGGAPAMEFAKEIDDFVSKADNTTGSVWKRAIAARRSFAEKFEEPKVIANILNSESPDEISQYIWAEARGAGGKGKGNVKKILNAVRPEDRESAKTVIKQSLIDKMLKQASANTVETKGGIDIDQVSKAVKFIKDRRNDLWGIFTPDEQRMLENITSSSIKNDDVISKIGKLLYKITHKVATKNIELPSTLKPKNIYSLEDVIAMARQKPPSVGDIRPYISGLAGAEMSRNIDFE